MAKLDFCIRTADLRAKMHDGRHDLARREARDLLRQGFATRSFLSFVAELLEPQIRGRGQPKHPPSRWLEIGERYREMRDNGATHDQVIEGLAKEFSASEGTVRRAHEMYERAKDDHDQLADRK
ncbi:MULTISPECIES: hypothetical protein [Bradyrhizobium]|jgi:hypothetical protein|uniref:hypothetical protein n=1 Tax=Bradyrhizobium TaxID=374 RepID=UPI0005772460|nr:hypothetical protein [Bradyrhizobium japonicum]MCP1764988.1 hypothetical protein [Bradyrhizobium japonicum]MCP1787125.1 hypothetical protein [Bradyrhizobium japonicum]MCP1809002.1 hypothetical protein [Bradyrhizobium japonicum]MCP1817932.1 hypothetical protein [Bradyrhizobium japonicum]MCP1870557.1 hypothetical protein [Bradyrhizobium japonicum]